MRNRGIACRGTGAYCESRRSRGGVGLKRRLRHTSRLAARFSRVGLRARDERGQAVIEFLVILPVFLALVFGVVELGKGYSYWTDMTHLAGEGGRYASVS